jgi:phosphate acetyltransferase
MIGRTIDDLREGDAAELVRRIESSAIEEFVEAVGDRNPLHSDPTFAAATAFGGPIAPGVFTAGLISAVIGTQLPGPGAVYVSQTLKFLKPVRAGDTITARVEVLEVVRERNRIRLATVCRNQRGEEVLTGEAWVMPARQRVTAPRVEPRPEPLLLLPWLWASRALALWSAFGLALLRVGFGSSRR